MLALTEWLFSPTSTMIYKHQASCRKQLTSASIVCFFFPQFIAFFVKAYAVAQKMAKLVAKR
jgi:hypothetical protein